MEETNEILTEPEAPAEIPEERTPPEPESEPGQTAPEPDYERMAEEDLREIKQLNPAMAGLTHLGEMPGAVRFAELRGLGLTVGEALRAVGDAEIRKEPPPPDNRAHLHPSVPRGANSGAPRMSYGELESARALFSGLSDREIAALYRKVNT